MREVFLWAFASTRKVSDCDRNGLLRINLMRFLGVFHAE